MIFSTLIHDRRNCGGYFPGMMRQARIQQLVISLYFKCILHAVDKKHFFYFSKVKYIPFTILSYYDPGPIRTALGVKINFYLTPDNGRYSATETSFRNESKDTTDSSSPIILAGTGKTSRAYENAELIDSDFLGGREPRMLFAVA
ncbi:MAG: hypothetical protein ACU833_05375 [Gammaproteobacteria bacterium]